MMSDRCGEFREISPGGREMAASGDERVKHRAWTHDKMYLHCMLNYKYTNIIIS